MKIITTDGRVTLRGPVDSTEEKRTIGEVIVMSMKSVFCISTSREQADRIVGQMIGILPDKARDVFPGPPGHVCGRCGHWRAFVADLLFF